MKSLAQQRVEFLEVHPNFNAGYVTYSREMEAEMMAQPEGTLFVVTSDTRTNRALTFVCCTTETLNDTLNMMIECGDMGLEVFARRPNRIGLHSFVFYPE